MLEVSKLHQKRILTYLPSICTLFCLAAGLACCAGRECNVRIGTESSTSSVGIASSPGEGVYGRQAVTAWLPLATGPPPHREGCRDCVTTPRHGSLTPPRGVSGYEVMGTRWGQIEALVPRDTLQFAGWAGSALPPCKQGSNSLTRCYWGGWRKFEPPFWL